MERSEIIDTIKACYAARMAGDMATLDRLCSADSRFEVVGDKSLIAAYPAAGPMEMRPALDEIVRLIRMTRAEPVSVVVDGDRAAINWLFEWTNGQGARFRMIEVALQQWENDQIVFEQYFYDTAGLRVK